MARPARRGTMALCLLVSAAALAGCASPGGGPGPADDADHEPLPAAGPVVALACPSNCWEPAIAVDLLGRIFVATAHEATLAVSEDGGGTWTALGAPPMPAGAPPGTAPFDGTVAASPDGRLYYYSFVAPYAEAPLLGATPAGPMGLQVAISSDGGRAWDTNVFLSLLDVPADSGAVEPVVSPWKSWIGFAPDGAVYLDYNSRGTGLWLTRSDDGGITWEPFTRVNPPEDRIISVFMGPPVVDSQGRLSIAYFGDQTPNFLDPLLPQGHQLRVARSDDRGATFQQTVVAMEPVPDYVGAFFPALAVDSSDRMALAHWDPEGTVQVYASFDRGETWRGPEPWSGDEPTHVAPWIALDNGLVSLAFYQGSGIGYARGSIAGGQLSGPAQMGSIAPAAWGGDFVHFALDAAGRMVVPVPDADAQTVSVAWGPLPA